LLDAGVALTTEGMMLVRRVLPTGVSQVVETPAGELAPLTKTVEVLVWWAGQSTPGEQDVMVTVDVLITVAV